MPASDEKSRVRIPKKVAWVRIRTKMSRILNTAVNILLFFRFKIKPSELDKENLTQYPDAARYVKVH